MILKFCSLFSMKILYANRTAPDGTPHSAASHLGLYYLPRSHKKVARLIQDIILSDFVNCQKLTSKRSYNWPLKIIYSQL